MHDSITHFIASELLRGSPGRVVGPDENLLAPGMIDSLGIVMLIAFIERETGLAIPPEDVTIRNFKSVNTIVGYLEHRTSERNETP